MRHPQLSCNAFLPVSLQLPPSSSTQPRPSAEHPRKSETVSSAHLCVPTPHSGPSSSRLGSSCCPSWKPGMLNPMCLKGLCIPPATTSLHSHPNPLLHSNSGCALPKEGATNLQGRNTEHGMRQLRSTAPLELPEGSWNHFMEQGSIALRCGEEGKEPGWAGSGLQGRIELCLLGPLAEVHAGG